MKVNVLMIMLFVNIGLSAQSKQDYFWCFGDDLDVEEGIQNLEFNFNEVPFSPKLKTHALSYDQNNASICDEDGNLLLYTNGCAVANKDHEVMMNGDSINWGNFAEHWWFDGDCTYGYPGRQDIVILPDPGNELGFYILHKTMEFNFGTDFRRYLRYMKYSYVDLTEDNGLGAVTEKNIVFKDGRPLWGYLSTISHSNQQDYWIIQPKDTSNTYYRFLLDENGINELDSIEIGTPFVGANSQTSGETKFSPDGTMYAFYNKYDGLKLFDFDRTTGMLSNVREMKMATPESPTFSGMEFSPNSQFIYLASRDSLWQVDAFEENLEDGKVFIDVWNGVLDPFETNFFMTALAPDCKIYTRPGSSTGSFSVIHKPDEKGLACDFVQQGLTLPGLTSTGSFPNFPRFRVDEEEKCDPTITSFLGDEVYYRRDLEVYPNPVQQDLNIKIPEQQSGQVIIYDMEGKTLIGPIVVSNQTDIYQVDVSALATGTYIVEYVNDDRKERLVYNQKFVKI